MRWASKRTDESHPSTLAAQTFGGRTVMKRTTHASSLRSRAALRSRRAHAESFPDSRRSNASHVPQQFCMRRWVQRAPRQSTGPPTCEYRLRGDGRTDCGGYRRETAPSSRAPTHAGCTNVALSITKKTSNVHETRAERRRASLARVRASPHQNFRVALYESRGSSKRMATRQFTIPMSPREGTASKIHGSRGAR
jgi:hypothetical protein